MPSEPLWAGRSSKPPAPEAHALGRSLRFDVRLAAYDVEASVAHAGALRDAGIVTADEANRLSAALNEVGDAIADGSFVFDDADEDIHSAIERGVTDRLGDLGAKLHAGRSRNDLVATDVRLWMRATGRRITGLTAMLVRTLIARARENARTVMPGSTHTRPAQPVTLGHHLLAHSWALMRDLQRFDELDARSNVSPLGAGALATSTLGLDPSATAERLGFASAFRNSLDAVSDRDAVQEFLAVTSILATHLSRLGADIARLTDPAIGWAQLDDGYTTGSSMMPQKANPDTAELVRAKAARIGADFTTLMSVLIGLPLGYHRDLQEDKEPLFDAAGTLELTLPAMIGAIETIRFDVEAMRAACEDDGLYATDIAEALVGEGVPFREAHRRTGELLRSLGDRRLKDLSKEEWHSFGLSEGADLLDPERSVAARSGPGGPSPGSVEEQAAAIERSLTERRS